MKPTMALKPLVFALAAVMAVAVQAGEHRRHHDHGPTWEQQLLIDAAATATVGDSQESSGNSVLNQATENSAEVENSLNGSDGNMGANVAGGDGNQQDNAVALATADESFIFGSAVATSTAYQDNTNNSVRNFSTQNTATLDNSGNNGSGNLGINVTAGNFNQQKNNLAVAVSGGRIATASADASQYSGGLDVDNKGVRTFKTDTLTGTVEASGTYKGSGSGSVRDSDGWRPHDERLTFTEQGTIDLSGVTTQQVLTKDGWKDPVVNYAGMSNSMNGFSGNGGANVSAGVANQQSNSMSIAAGCKACPSTF
jgi:hypothetical protein